MKKHLLLIFVLSFLITEIHAQVKATGVVNLLSGMTANLSLDNNTNTATLTFTGPSDRWFALQFGDFNTGGGMGNGEDIVYYNGSTLADAVHNGIGIPPSSDSNDWNVVSNTTSGGTRTLIATRAFDTGDANDYTFNYANNTIDFAFSRSSTASFTLAYHGFSNRGYAIDNPFTTLGVDDYKITEHAISLIPNPATTSFKIHTSTNLNIKQVVIYNVLGQELISVTSESYDYIDISSLSTGNYYVEVMGDENNVLIKKLTIR